MTPTADPGSGASPSDWRVRAAAPDDGRPLLLSHGNCQAESLRVLATNALGPGVSSVRLPPVFELTPADVEPLRALLRRTALFITQPVVDGYNGVPVGMRQLLAHLPASAVVARVPPLRWAALMPTHAIVRAAGVGDPPVVPYHDLRVLAAAAAGRAEVDLAEPTPGQVRAMRDISRRQLRIRQDHHGTVDALGCFEAAGGDAAWTINHPTNRVLRAVVEQVLERLGLPRPVPDPGRVLLATTTAPVYASTLAALAVDGTPRAGWVHAGRRYGEAEVARAQLAWYREHPQLVEAGLRRHEESLTALGL